MPAHLNISLTLFPCCDPTFLFSGDEGPGKKIMERVCTPPLNGGLNCSGESTREEPCAGEDDGVFRCLVILI